MAIKLTCDMIETYQNVPHQLADLSDCDVTVAALEQAEALSFAASSVIRGEYGMVAVDAVEVGDLIWTKDHGLQPVRWVGKSEIDLIQAPDLAPIEILRGALGAGVPRRPVLVSPQHRVLVAGAAVELYLGQEEALVPAFWLADGDRIRQRRDLTKIAYVQLMFDNHEIVDSGGFLSESLVPDVGAITASDKSGSQSVGQVGPLSQSFEDPEDVALVRPEIRGKVAALFGRAA